MARIAQKEQPAPRSLDREIAQLRDLDLSGLRARWKSVFRKVPPAHLPRHLLLGILVYRMQADALGDLAPDTARMLKQVGGDDKELDIQTLSSELVNRRADLRTGTILVREWNGRPHRVMVMADGFAWNGRSYDSLSAVAFAITGTRWNGHRFFGLRAKVRDVATIAKSS
jgi:hypothetical protein